MGTERQDGKGGMREATADILGVVVVRSISAVGTERHTHSNRFHGNRLRWQSSIACVRSSHMVATGTAGSSATEGHGGARNRLRPHELRPTRGSGRKMHALLAHVLQ